MSVLQFFNDSPRLTYNEYEVFWVIDVKNGQPYLSFLRIGKSTTAEYDCLNLPLNWVLI